MNVAVFASPVRWLTDKAYRDSPIQEKALAWADSFVGKREEGRNAGPFVVMLLSSIGLKAGNPWCAAFLSYCLTKSGYLGGPTWGRGSVKRWVEWAESKGKLSGSPERGCLVYWLNKNGTGHIEIFAGFGADGKYRTIGGNTNSDASREGDGVYKKLRDPRLFHGCILWWK